MRGWRGIQRNYTPWRNNNISSCLVCVPRDIPWCYLLAERVWVRMGYWEGRGGVMRRWEGEAISGRTGGLEAGDTPIDLFWGRAALWLEGGPYIWHIKPEGHQGTVYGELWVGLVVGVVFFFTCFVTHFYSLKVLFPYVIRKSGCVNVLKINSYRTNYCDLTINKFKR